MFGNYIIPTKEDLQSAVREIRAELSPVAAYATGMQGQSRGISLTTGNLAALVLAVSLIVGIVMALAKLH